MDYEHPKYFDYLADYGDVLAYQLRLSDLVEDIAFWRKNGLENPDGAVTYARKVIERVLDRLINDKARTRKMRLVNKVDYAKRTKKITASYAKKFTEIRITGNTGTHATVDAIQASRSLVLLDEILRKYVAERIDEQVIYSLAISEESPFVVRTDEEVSSFVSDSSAAAALSGNPGLEETAQTVKSVVESQNAAIRSGMAKMESLFDQLLELSAEEGQQEKFLEQLEVAHKHLVESKQKVDAAVSQAEADVAEILSEHDFIEKLLRGTGQATKEQMDVLAFPKSEDAKTNVLQIAGGAGTGKTLCLLAKLIRETETANEGRQLSLYGDDYQRTALFVCFNRALAAHVREMLGEFDQVAGRVVMVSFDEFANQLVRYEPKRGFEWLKDYAQDVRYEDGWSITYETSAFIKQAMAEIGLGLGASGKRLIDDAPLRRYVDSADADHVEWMKDEISWLESRYTMFDEAWDAYPTAPRTGRGRGHSPSKEARRVILKVWQRFCALLEQRHMYTINQAVQRLVRSSSLPKFDRIAIDEAQDFTVLSIRFVSKMLRGDKSRLYLSGDEGQKIYNRDFTWKEIGEGLHGRTITLKQGMRSTPSIYAFADRLLGRETDYELASKDVVVASASEADILDRFRELGEEPERTTVLIGGWEWFEKAAEAGIEVSNPRVTNQWGNREISNEGQVLAPGRYIVPEFKNKGLEFDNVIVVDHNLAGEVIGVEESQELSMRYVHYSRARWHLEVLYPGRPSCVLQEYYPDFLQ